MTTDRERFIALLFTGPLLRADAIVVLCGEDADERGNVAVELFTQGAAPVVVCSGALHDPPHKISGAELASLLLARGVAPECILVEHGSQHTAEQARNIVEMAVLNGWTRILLVASAYHAPRAFLTFLKALGAAEIHLVAVPASHLPWHQAPPGMTATRLEILDNEFEKVDRYAKDCATWTEGLAYLAAWEGK